jgi:hypothetical protein
MQAMARRQSLEPVQVAAGNPAAPHLRATPWRTLFATAGLRFL